MQYAEDVRLRSQLCDATGLISRSDHFRSSTGGSSKTAINAITTENTDTLQPFGHHMKKWHHFVASRHFRASNARIRRNLPMINRGVRLESDARRIDHSRRYIVMTVFFQHLINWLHRSTNIWYAVT